MSRNTFSLVLASVMALSVGRVGLAQTQQPPPQKPPATAQQQKPQEKPPAGQPATPTGKAPAVTPASNPGAKPSAGVPVPDDFVLGPDDVVHVEFWRDKDMTADAVVRPDGKITLPLLSDIQAGGLTPAQLRDKVIEAASRLLEDPTAIVVVKEIHSRKVFIQGEVNKPGAYLLNDRMTVLQFIATAGGLTEYAKKNKIVIIRSDAGKQVTLPFNYKDVIAGKNLKQNIDLRPGDTVIVP